MPELTSWARAGGGGGVAPAFAAALPPAADGCSGGFASSCDSCKRMSTQSVLLVPRLVGNAGALLQEGVGDLDVNVLLFVARFGARAVRGR